MVSVIVAEVGENIHAGQPVLVIDRSTRAKMYCMASRWG